MPVAASFDLKVADAVWVATAMLHNEFPKAPGFSVRTITEKVRSEHLTEGADASVYLHVNQHCVANRPPKDAKLCMLREVPGNLRRLHCPTEPTHPERTGRFCPEPRELPDDLLWLVSWYEKWCTRQASLRLEDDPLLALAGTGKGLWGADAVRYVRQLREG